MMKIEREDDGLIRVEIGGKIDATDMRAGIEELLRLAEDTGKMRLLYRITDIQIPTAEAIGVEFSYLPRLFGLISKFDRVALLANQAWVRNAAKVESALIPGLRIEIFDPGDEAGARAWLSATAEA
ncbi:hypothetical protein DDZ14_02115 [Maritimibacter sp. 55A14]|uniref:STAS/SEC14 domain-containing protein n=1 Tax=Maritimibacter sp. 55A14 TaxID=2174844 RepID=UPI000D617049|nr:STAS/SEC14 domain-containing protein [Maritimibacter sp. 55A14]PWE33980.1 hypothetical protein DDZ14_02115 [Maritimibacter sp. 55A14]